MKLDYETIALRKAETKGPKEVEQYKKTLKKNIKFAMKYHPKWWKFDHPQDS